MNAADIKRSTLTLALAAASLALTACGGGGSNSPLPSAAHGSGLIAADFIMHWPALASRTPSSARKPRWISPSTKSLAVVINDDPSLTTIVNSPATTSQGAISNVTVMAPPGNDSITFELFDQAQTAGEAAPVGNEVGEVTVTQTITAGGVNTIKATVDGLVANVALAPLPNQPFVSSTPDATGVPQYVINGDTAITFAATAKDADGNIILGPGDPIAYTAHSTNAAMGLTAVSGKSNEFSVQPLTAPNPGSSVGVVVQATDGTGTSAQSNYSVTLAPLTYVAYKNGGSGTIAAFDSSGKQLQVSGFSGPGVPASIAYDQSDHTLFELDSAAGVIRAYKSDGTVLSGFTPIPVPGATAMAFDAYNGELYVTNATTVLAFKHDGTPVTLPGAFPNLAAPNAISVKLISGAPSLIYVANAGNDTVSFYNEDGTPGPFVFPLRNPYFSTSAAPAGVGVFGAIVFVASGSGSGSLLQSYVNGRTRSSMTTGLSTPTGVAYNANDGNVYVANSASGAVTAYDLQLQGLVTTIPAPSGLSVPTSMAFAF